MKADRLITILLLLQNRKRMTTHELAAEMGVSPRTIFRDLVALSSGGFPIYCEHGPGGGVRLVEEYQGNLKTLTRDEINALQLVRIPDPLTTLEAGKTLQRALLKVFSTLPDQAGNQSNLFIDWNWWTKSGNIPEGGLEQFYNAVCRQQKMVVAFPLWNRTEFSQEIEPYGIVAKAGEWYLVYHSSGRIRMRRITEIKILLITDIVFQKPTDFDLEKTWKELCISEESGFYSYPVKLRVSPAVEAILHDPCWGIPYLVKSVSKEHDANGWVECILSFAHIFAARTHLMGWGNAVEVLSPEALRQSILDFARQIQSSYSEK